MTNPVSSYTVQRSDMTSISLDMHYDLKFSANPYLAVALLLLIPGILYSHILYFFSPCLIILSKIHLVHVIAVNLPSNGTT